MYRTEGNISGDQSLTEDCQACVENQREFNNETTKNEVNKCFWTNSNNYESFRTVYLRHFFSFHFTMNHVNINVCRLKC